MKKQNKQRENVTTFIGTMYTDIEWLFLKGKLLGRNLKETTTITDIEGWLYE